MEMAPDNGVSAQPIRVDYCAGLDAQTTLGIDLTKLRSDSDPKVYETDGGKRYVQVPVVLFGPDGYSPVHSVIRLFLRDDKKHLSMEPFLYHGLSNEIQTPWGVVAVRPEQVMGIELDVVRNVDRYFWNWLAANAGTLDSF